MRGMVSFLAPHVDAKVKENCGGERFQFLIAVILGETNSVYNAKKLEWWEWFVRVFQFMIKMKW